MLTSEVHAAAVPNMCADTNHPLQMEGFNDVVAFDEIIDNSIRAQAATITFGVVAAGSGAVDGLACLDDGVSVGIKSVMPL